jgi:hypothetical protein
LTVEQQAALQTEVAQLQALLASDDLKATHAFEVLKPQLMPLCDPTRLNRLARHLDDFAFDLALKDLQTLRATCLQRLAERGPLRPCHSHPFKRAYLLCFPRGPTTRPRQRRQSGKAARRQGGQHHCTGAPFSNHRCTS